ncbi:MAG: ribulokinase [bacterium]
MDKYSIGVDYGTNSVRALVVNVLTGEEVGACVWDYRHGRQGIVLDSRNPNLARQHPQDYLDGLEASVRGALKQAAQTRGFSSKNVIGVGVDTTGSTPMPVDASGIPLALTKRFARNPAAMAWLWKDHTSHGEAAEITALAKTTKPEYLAKCGGVYSSEWFWSKLLHCRRTAPAVFDAAYTWVELSDWIPAVLSATTDPRILKRGICAAGHKAMFNPAWGGYPDVAFLKRLDPGLARVRTTLPGRAYHVGDSVGGLADEWADRLGLPTGIPIAVGAFDAHLGAIGAGIMPGALVNIIGTSSCDIAVAPMKRKLKDIPGLCGIVPESVLPGYYGLEAGQSAVGDIFNWFVTVLQPGNGATHVELTRKAEMLAPGQSGLLALDWHNGNRTVLVDQRLTGMIMGLTLHSTPAEIYRALVEATAFGARVIVERFEAYDVEINRVIMCGGISQKSPMIMQIYADVLNRPIEISSSTQTCALGAAMAGAVVAGARAGGHASFGQASKAMTGMLPKRFRPDRRRAAVYERLYGLYKCMHDTLGTKTQGENPQHVMKALLEIRDRVGGHSL